MSVYVPVDLQRVVRARWENCCAYCHTAEALTVVVFEFEHIVPIVALTPTRRATVAALRMNRPPLVRIRRMWVAMDEHPPEIA